MNFVDAQSLMYIFLLKNIIMTIHFCTFGSRPGYNKALERIQSQALASKYFDTVTVYDQTNTPGLEAHTEFIKTHKRGYGYWIWKPMVILDCMDKSNPGDIIVYSDAGSSIYATENAKNLFSEYISKVEMYPYRISFVNPFTERDWCKGDLLDLFGVRNTPHELSNQYSGGTQILKNTPENKALMEEWLLTMVRDNYHYVDDSPSISPNHKTFQEHRHDASIISILKKLRGGIEIQMAGKNENYPISITRMRDR